VHTPGTHTFMAAAKAPSSKYKYLLGTPAQPVDCIGGIALGSVSPDSNVIKVNAKWIAVPWKITGTLGIIDINTKGALPEEIPLLVQEDTINEFAFNPFNNDMIATACQDGSSKIWAIPPEGLKSNLGDPIATLASHTKRLMFLDWHPLASNVLLTASADEVKLWDVATGSVQLDFPKVYKGQVTSVAWNYDGSNCATASKDKALRIVDPRSNSVAAETQAHTGAKGWRVVWCGNRDRLLSVGFTKEAGREISLWDPRALAKPINVVKLDVSPAAPMPFYDPDCNVLYLGSKGEGAIKLYEVTDSSVNFLSDYKSAQPASGMAMQSKWVCDPMKCEVAKCMKLTAQGQIIPIRFEVPRSNMNLFHEDLYPDSFDGQPVMTSDDWFGGRSQGPTLIPVKPK